MTQPSPPGPDAPQRLQDPLDWAPALAAAGAAPLPRPPIVLVEDERATVEMTRAMLTAHGYQVYVAGDGHDAMRQLLGYRAAIVISDWAMPGMNGIELCRQIHDCPDIGFTYFIMLTAHASLSHRVEAFQQGVDDFITKPVAPEELTARLYAARRILHLEQNLQRQHRQAQYLNAELAMLNDQLNQAVSYDALTRVFSRRSGDEALKRQWAKAVQTGRPLSCLLLDIDRFKAINDTHDHTVGDQVLQWVGTLLNTHVPHDHIAYRFGGDEFLVVCPDTPLEQVQCLGRRLSESSREMSPPAPVAVTLSIGVAQRRADMAGPEDLIRATDHALVAAKQGGRDRVRSDRDTLDQAG